MRTKKTFPNGLQITLLKDVGEHLRVEWHSTHNQGLDFEKLRANSTRKVWWQCAKHPKHAWQAHVRRRAIDGNGCPFCSGLKVSPENSLATLYPKIAAEWHPTRNGNLNPQAVTSKSNRRVWWMCNSEHKHEWQATIKTRATYTSACNQCLRIKNPLSKTFPHIAKEWHSDKNGDLRPEGIVASSRRKVWWQCLVDRDHEWEAGVDVRTRAKSQCPVCRKAQLPKVFPKLSICRPDLAAQWHAEKNGTLMPDDVSPNSRQKVWWICPADTNHVWEANIRNRTAFGYGCRYCARGNKHPLAGQSLADLFPEIAEEWHPTLNNIKANEVMPGSSQRVWWRCKSNPLHVWDATVTNRTNKRSRGRCVYCSGFRVTEANSLAMNHPEIAKQLHPSKNGDLTPHMIKRASGRKVWWQCDRNPEHEWMTTVRHRTLLGTGCTHCEMENRGARLRKSLSESVQANVDPFKTFEQSIASLRSLEKLNQPRSAKLKLLFHRMLYSSAITALETYLSDAFYQEVMKDELLLRKLILTTPEFQERKYALSEMLGWSERTRERVEYYLLDIVWHNLAKVRAMYKTVLGIYFPEDSEDVHRAVVLRHDLVHRNGRTKEGRVRQLSDTDVRALFDAVSVFVSKINRQIITSV